MKICLVSYEYPPFVGSGPGQYACNLVKYLLSKGNEVTIITALLDEQAKLYEKNDNLEIIRLNVYKNNKSILLSPRLFFSMKSRKFLKKFDFSKYNLLHIIDKSDSYFLNDNIKIPKIVSVNDTYSLEISWNPLKFPYLSPDVIIRYFYFNIMKLVDRFYIKKADLLIANSRYTARKLSQLCKIPYETIHVIHRGVDINKFSTKIEASKYTSHKILYIGANTQRKGALYLIQSLPYVLKVFPDARLIIIGKTHPAYKRYFKFLIKKHNMQGKVELIDRVSSEDTVDYYAKANVFCIPSVQEALGQVQMEAMANKTPVIGTRVGGIPETITKKTGILVEPRNPKQIAEAVISIFADPALAKEMGEDGYKHVKKNFNSKSMGEKTYQLYLHMLKRVN